MMRVSEIYTSVQGEGPRVGETTVFLRFGGCNLRCPGWPCDTQHAIDPAYRSEWEKLDAARILERTRAAADMAGATSVTFTGGEPFLQRHADLLALSEGLLAEPKPLRLEAFTNGTLLYPQWAVDSVDMIMDWKLPDSGEDSFNDNRIKNLAMLAKANREAGRQHSVKFVCKSYEDAYFAYSLWSVYLQDLPEVRVYYGRVWDGEISNAELAACVMENKLPWYLNVQMHNYIWPANERGR